MPQRRLPDQRIANIHCYILMHGGINTTTEIKDATLNDILFDLEEGRRALIIMRAEVARLKLAASLMEKDRDEAIRRMAKYARIAGEAEGALRISEKAGIVEGWMIRATQAEEGLALMEAQATALREDRDRWCDKYQAAVVQVKGVV